MEREIFKYGYKYHFYSTIDFEIGLAVADRCKFMYQFEDELFEAKIKYRVFRTAKEMKRKNGTLPVKYPTKRKA